jgi:hypothetical protein
MANAMGFKFGYAFRENSGGASGNYPSRLERTTSSTLLTSESLKARPFSRLEGVGKLATRVRTPFFQTHAFLLYGPTFRGSLQV